MNYITKYSSFNEGIGGTLLNNLRKSASSIKGGVVNMFKDSNEYKKELKQYRLKCKKISDILLNIYHDNKLVGDIKLDVDSKLDYPIWILTVYFYESEIKKDGNNYKKPDDIDGQNEQPYAKNSSLKFKVVSDDAIDKFIKWWSTKTKSGRSKNNDFKIN